MLHLYVQWVLSRRVYSRAYFRGDSFLLCIIFVETTGLVFLLSASFYWSLSQDCTWRTRIWRFWCTQINEKKNKFFNSCSVNVSFFVNHSKSCTETLNTWTSNLHTNVSTKLCLQSRLSCPSSWCYSYIVLALEPGSQCFYLGIKLLRWSYRIDITLLHMLYISAWTEDIHKIVRLCLYYKISLYVI